MSSEPTDRRRRLFGIALVALTLVAVELLVRLAMYEHWIGKRKYPTAYSQTKIKFLGDIDPYFGVWHQPNAEAEMKTPEKKKISYRSNAQGMRDRPREFKSAAAERAVVLGDSFVEGYMVDTADRVTDVMEERTGVEFLNFGTSGKFGSIQEWMLYEHLALQFDHSRVFIFLLPDNDFADNDPAQNPPERYKPYLKETKGSYEVTYPYPFGQMEKVHEKMPWGLWMKNTVYNSWCTLNLLLELHPRRLRSHMLIASYDDYFREDMKQLLFTYEQIVRLAKPRPVTIVVIPRDRDFMALAKGKFHGRIMGDLNAFAAAHAGVKVVDLMPGFLAYMKEKGISYQPLFLGFDQHWSPLGHRIAADIVLESQPDLKRLHAAETSATPAIPGADAKTP